MTKMLYQCPDETAYVTRYRQRQLVVKHMTWYAPHDYWCGYVEVLPGDSSDLDAYLDVLPAPGGITFDGRLEDVSGAHFLGFDTNHWGEAGKWDLQATMAATCRLADAIEDQRGAELNG